MAFLALPVIAVAYGLATWAWHLISAAGSQMRERGRKEGRLSSFLVLAALGIGVVLLAAEVSLLWPSGGSDNHWPLRLLVTWAVVLLLSWAVRAFLVQYLGDVAAYVESHRSIASPSCGPGSGTASSSGRARCMGRLGRRPMPEWWSSGTRWARW